MEIKSLLNPVKLQATPFWRMLGYAFGGCAYQLPFNAMWAYAMIFYTQVIGLDFVLAGLALSITMFWDAIIDPFMGHISDNTRSRYGKRHPYILFGGIVLAISFYFIWAVPGFCTGKWAAFTYLLLVNFIFRTAIAIFAIPYGALGFEICTDYDERSKLQSTCAGLGMTANLLIGMGWFIFFPNRGQVDGTQFASNYTHMGLMFSIIALVMVAFCVWATRRYIRDTREDEKIMGNSLRSFYIDIRDILLDKRALIVFLFFGISQAGSVLVACWQTYVWVYYMKFGGMEKTICHIAGMAGFIFGAILSTLISKKLDKKFAFCIGAGLCIISSAALLLIFYTGVLSRSVNMAIPNSASLLAGVNISISLIVFSFLQGIYWMGNGIMGPLAVSMIADISEINKHESGILKDGSYSAVFTFIVKIVGFIGLLVQGICLKFIGFKEGSEEQTPDAINRLVLCIFACGIIFALAALLAAMRYRIDRHFMKKIKDVVALRET